MYHGWLVAGDPQLQTMPPINDHPIVPDQRCRASAHAGNNKLFMLPELLSPGHIQLETDESFLHLISSDLQMSLERLGRAATVRGVCQCLV